MYERIYTHVPSIERYLAAPLLQERVSFLEHCEDCGVRWRTLRKMASNQLRLVRLLPLNELRTVCLSEIEAVADEWSRSGVFHSQTSGSPKYKAQCVHHLVSWMRFLGSLAEPDVPPPHSHVAEVAEFAEWAREERGYSDQSIEGICGAANEFFVFLDGCGPEARLSNVAMADIDRAFEAKSDGRTPSRRTISSYASRLRAFFRFAEERGLCRQGLAGAIKGPRIFTHETFPSRLSREDVLRVLATTEGDGRIAIRDRAVLMLLVVYGLRSGEIRNLQLDDLDWENQTLRVRRSKSGRLNLYPLSPTVAEAILRYVREVRPAGFTRHLFFTVVAPFRPLTRAALGCIVRSRMRRLGIHASQCGPHALRHAAAQHLLAKGMSLKIIGDFLGHTRVSSTQLYVRFDLKALRRVADLDLGFLP